LQDILEFFQKFIDYVSTDLQFVIDAISEEDSIAVGVTWHLGILKNDISLTSFSYISSIVVFAQLVVIEFLNNDRLEGKTFSI